MEGWALRLFLSLLSLTYNFISNESGHIVALVACSLPLVAGLSQAWSLQLVTIDRYLGAKSLPGIAHNLELSCDSLQLWPWRVCDVYCESSYFHISFIVSAGPELYKPRTKKISQIYCTGKSPNEGKTVSYHLWDWLSSLELAAWGLQLFSFIIFSFIIFSWSRALFQPDHGSRARSINSLWRKIIVTCRLAFELSKIYQIDI